MYIHQKQIIINGMLVNYYHRTGDTQAPVLLFLHGWRSEGKIWQKVIGELSEYSSYSIDFPGFGQSDLPNKDFKLQDYSEIVSEFIKKLNLKNVIIIGHSFGGRVGIKLASTSPPSLSKLILVDSAGIKVKQNSLKKIIAKIIKPIFKLPFLKSTRKKIYSAMGSEDYLATPELQQTFINIINEDLTSLLPKIKIPTLLIWGENDKDAPLADARTMEQAVPNSKLVILKDTGHFSFVDQTEKFVNNIKKFV